MLPESRKAQRVVVIGRPRDGAVARSDDMTAGSWNPRCYREADRPHMLAFTDDGKPTGSPTRALILGRHAVGAADGLHERRPHCGAQLHRRGAERAHRHGAHARSASQRSAAAL